MKIQRINGKLYQEIDEQVVMQKMTALKSELYNYSEGIKQCEVAIKAGQDRISQYKSAIAQLFDTSGLDRELIAALAPDTVDCLGF